jgi:hypothetical protein
MLEPKFGQILPLEGNGIRATVSFNEGPEGASITVMLEEKDYTLEEFKRLAVERAYEVMKQALDAKPA